MPNSLVSYQQTTSLVPASGATSQAAQDALKREGVKSLGKFIEPGLEGLSLIMDYRANRNNGDSRGKALTKAAAWGAFYAVTPMKITLPASLAMSGAKAIPEVMAAAQQTAGVSEDAHFGSFGSDTFHLSEQAATMREAGVQAIQNNGLNARSVLGSEARRYSRR